MFDTLYPTYSLWKSLKTTLSLTAYYVQEPLRYSAVLVDTTNDHIWVSTITRDAVSATLSDFESTIKPTATAVSSVDDAVAKAFGA